MAGVIATSSNHAPGTFALRPRVLRTLLWLRWQLLVRGYARSVSRIIGAIVLALLLIPLSGLLAFGLVATFQNVRPAHELIAENILFYLLTIIYLIYAFLPLLQYNLNEGLDITKLANYPLSQPELMASLLISTLLDIPTLAVLLVFVGVGIGWTQTVGQGLLIGVALLLAYIHLVAISQLLLSSLMGLLRNRRFRDITLVLGTLLGLSCSLGSQVVTRLVRPEGDASGVIAFINYDVGQWLQFTPPGMAARAVVAESNGQSLVALLWLAVLALAAIPVLWAWSTVLARGLATPEDGGSTRTRTRKTAKVAPTPTGTTVVMGMPVAAAVAPSRRALIPAPVLAIARKDLLYYWRDPMYKRSFMGSLYFVGIILLNLFTVSANRQGSGFSQVLVGAALFLVLNLTSNAFGYEGATMTTLAFFPIRPIHLFMGRNLAALSVGIIEMVLLLGLQGFISQDWRQVAVLAIAGFGALLAAMGPGNVIAVFFPIRVNRTGLGRAQNDSGTGCLTGLVSIAGLAVSVLLLSPIILLVFVPQWTGHPELSLPLAPIAILYGLAVYMGGTALAASQYYQRVAHIIEVVARE